MDILKELIAIDSKASQPVYLQIANAFIHSIRSGRLRKGLKLPGSRQLGKLLNINRMTAVSAYDELQAQGWIEAIPRKGTFVKQGLSVANPLQTAGKKKAGFFPKTALFLSTNKDAKTYISSPTSGKLIINDGFPDTRLTPIQPLVRSMRSMVGKPVFRKYLRYGNPLGTDELRETLAAYLNDTRGLPITVKNIMITRGAQMGINLCSRLLIQKGDAVIVGEPGYFGANSALQGLGAKLCKVPVDEQGIVVDVVEKICSKKDIKLLYAVPHHHHPTTVTLTPERRIRLLELAKKYKFAIIEDDYDYDFHYVSSPMMPMASLDQYGSVIYIGTFTKTLAPAIRIGFIVAADNVIQALSGIRQSIDFQGDNLLELAISSLYKDGTMARYIRKSIKLYHKRRDHFCYLLESKLGKHVSFNVPDGGMSVWTKFMDVDLEDLSKIAFKKGLIISDGKEYNTGTENYSSIRMGFASLNLDEQEKAVAILAECVRGVRR